eukprot:COSAG01_NODE_5975_length_3921_cov_8.965201_3_plen_133_part_00
MVLSLLMGRGVKSGLASQIRNHFALTYRDRSAIPADQFLFALPEHYQKQVAIAFGYLSRNNDEELVEGILHYVPFFAGLDDLSLIMVCEKLKFWRVVSERPGDARINIMTEGTLSNEMFHLRDIRMLSEGLD